MLSSGNYPGVIDQLNELNTKGIILNQTEKENMCSCLPALITNAAMRNASPCFVISSEITPHPPMLSKQDFPWVTISFSITSTDALTEYDGIDFDRLNREDFALYTYRHALTQIKTGHYAEARQSLKALKENRLYREAYTFYTAYLDYIDGDYDKAYTGFSKVRSGEKVLKRHIT